MSCRLPREAFSGSPEGASATQRIGVAFLAAMRLVGHRKRVAPKLAREVLAMVCARPGVDKREKSELSTFS